MRKLPRSPHTGANPLTSRPTLNIHDIAHRLDNLPPSTPRVLDIDCFAGGGGASLAIERVTSSPVDLAINHDLQSLVMHLANHPRTFHFQKPVQDIPPEAVARLAPIRIAWFSPDCTFHSRAKGSAPIIGHRARCSRDLAWQASRWALHARPELIFVENVPEFVDWGPLDADGNRHAGKRGLVFRRWIDTFHTIGYATRYGELRASDFGSPTSRNRFFLVARRDGRTPGWPSPTHGPGLRDEVSAASCIDWTVPTPSLFLQPEEARRFRARRPLAKATLRRLALGVYKYILDDPAPHVTASPAAAWFAPQNNTGLIGRPLARPLSTIVGKGSTQALLAAFLSRQFTGSIGQSASRPAPTTTAGGGGKTALVLAHLGPSTPDRRKDVLTYLRHHHAAAAHLCPCRNGAPCPAVTGTTRIRDVDYTITDLGFRMLTARELFRAQGFPDSYIINPPLDGKPLPDTAQKRLCGNSVAPQPAEALIRSNLESP